jgi:GTP cyclohydrolase I
MNGDKDIQAKLRIEKSVRELIIPAITEDPNREGLRDTPRRFAEMILELTEGLRGEPPEITTFERGKSDQMIVVKGISYWSLCEHHIVPFYGQVHVGYLPQSLIAGLSKFSRVIDYFSRRLQIQEHMTAQIADFLTNKLHPEGLIVVVEGTHLCISMRGVQKPNQVTITSAMRGDIDRNEFFDILKVSNGK